MLFGFFYRKCHKTHHNVLTKFLAIFGMETSNQTYYNWPMNKDGTQGKTSTCAFEQGRVVYTEQWLSQKNNVQKFVIYTVAESK